MNNSSLFPWRVSLLQKNPEFGTTSCSFVYTVEAPEVWRHGEYGSWEQSSALQISFGSVYNLSGRGIQSLRISDCTPPVFF